MMKNIFCVERKKLNLVVVLDISGSMDSYFDEYYYDDVGDWFFSRFLNYKFASDFVFFILNFSFLIFNFL